jgi:hypothetical protein
MSIYNLEILSGNLNTEILSMDSGAGGSTSGGSTSGGGGFSSGSNPGGSPGGGPGWKPFHYLPMVREDGERYSDDVNPAAVLNTYDPAGDTPVRNDKELGILIDYRFHHIVKPLGYHNWNISEIFPSDSVVDKMARARLLGHIYDNKSILLSAYKESGMSSGIPPKWASVKVTSFIINSLNHSNN